MWKGDHFSPCRRQTIRVNSRTAEPENLAQFWDRVVGSSPKAAAKPIGALLRHILGQRFGTVEALISGPSDFVPKLTVCRTSTRQNSKRSTSRAGYRSQSVPRVSKTRLALRKPR